LHEWQSFAVTREGQFGEYAGFHSWTGTASLVDLPRAVAVLNAIECVQAVDEIEGKKRELSLLESKLPGLFDSFSQEMYRNSKESNSESSKSLACRGSTQMDF
jgi:hypothetical protein